MAGEKGAVLTVALQERGCHNDGGQDREGVGVQRDAHSGGFGGVAYGAEPSGRSGITAGGRSRACSDCGVQGEHLLERGEEIQHVLQQSSLKNLIKSARL